MVSKVCLSRTETDTTFIFVYIILSSFIKKAKLSWIFKSEQSKLNQSWVSWYLFVLFGTFHDLVLQIHDNTKTKSIHSLFANVSMIEMVSIPPPSYSLYNWHIQCLWFIKNKVLLFRSTKELRMWIKDSVAVDDFKINTMEKIISEGQFLFSTDFMRFVAVQFFKLLTFIPQSHISS